MTWHILCHFVRRITFHPVSIIFLIYSWDPTREPFNVHNSSLFYIKYRNIFKIPSFFYNIPQKIFFKLFNFCVYIFCLHIHMCIICVPGALSIQKRVSEPLKPELQLLLSLVASRNQTGLVWKTGSPFTSEPSLQFPTSKSLKTAPLSSSKVTFTFSFQVFKLLFNSSFSTSWKSGLIEEFSTVLQFAFDF